MLRVFRQGEDGQTLVLVVLCMAVLLGFMAFAIDVGQLLYTKRQMQTIADAAAAAAALEVQVCGSTANCQTMQNAVKSAMTENNLSGYTFLTQCDGTPGSGVTVELNNGPCAAGASDPNSGDTNYVETLAFKAQPTIFGRLLGVRSVTLTARSEAGGVNSPYCLFVSADNQGSGTGTVMQMNSGSQLTANCGVIVDSDATSALDLENGSQLTSTQTDVHGTYSSKNGSHSTPTPNNDVPPAQDPLLWLQSQRPVVGTCTNAGPFSGKNNTLSPGTYCGININSGGNLTLSPGTYVFTGSVNVNSGATISGNGVTLYFSSGTFQPNSGSTVDLIAPTTGTYAGILLFQSPTDTSGVEFDDGSKSVWQGAIYIPNATLTLNSGGNAAAYTIVDVGKLIMNSGAQFNIGTDYSSLGGHSPARRMRLLE